MRDVVGFGLLAILAIGNASARAESASSVNLEEMSLDDVLRVQVSSVSRKDEEVALAPSNVTVISAQQIRDWGARDLKDVLRRVPGFRIVLDRDEWVFSARGIVSDNTTQYNLLIDGRRVNHLDGNGAGYMMEAPGDLSNVKQIEVIRGPGSPLWGSGSLAGTINIVTWNGRDLKRPYNVGVGFGQYATRKANFQVGKAYGEDFDLFVAGTYFESDGRVLTMDSSDSLSVKDSTTGFTRSPTGRYTTNMSRFDPSFQFQLKARAGELTFNNFFFTPHMKNFRYEADGRAGRTTRVAKDVVFSEATWAGKFLGDGQVKARLSTDIQRYGYVNKEGSSSHVLSYDQAWMGFIDTSKPLGGGFALNIGGDYTATQLGPSFDSRTNLDGTIQYNTPGIAFQVRKMAVDKVLGAYAMLDYKPIETVTLSGGARVDHNVLRAAGHPNAIGPRASAVWQPQKDEVYKLLYNSGFYRPNWPQVIFGLTEIRPEQMQQVELVRIQRFGSGASLSTTAYWQRLKDSIAQSVPSGFANTGTYTAYGLEVEAATPISSHTGYVNLALQKSRGTAPSNLHPDDVRTDADGNSLNYPLLTLTTGGKLKLAQKLYANPAVRMNSPVTYRVTPATSAVSDATYSKIQTMYYVDMNLVYGDANDSVSYSIYADNLLNNRTPQPISIRNGTGDQFGRYVEARVTMRY